LRAIKPKGLNRIAQISYAWGRRTLVLVIITLFRTYRNQWEIYLINYVVAETLTSMVLWYDFREIKFYCANYISFMNINDNGDLLFLDLNIDRRHVFGTSVHCVTWPLWPWLHSTCSWIYIYIWNRCQSHMPEEEVYSIQHQVIIFTCDLRQLFEFLRVL